VTIRLLHPALATERMVDVEGYCRCSQAQGEPELQGMVSANTWVFRLVLEKVRVKTPHEQGADLTVTWHPPGTPDLSTS
jgi:hypothetical protein